MGDPVDAFAPDAALRNALHVTERRAEKAEAELRALRRRIKALMNRPVTYPGQRRFVSYAELRAAIDLPKKGDP